MYLLQPRGNPNPEYTNQDKTMAAQHTRSNIVNAIEQKNAEIKEHKIHSPTPIQNSQEYNPYFYSKNFGNGPRYFKLAWVWA